MAYNKTGIVWDRSSEWSIVLYLLSRSHLRSVKRSATVIFFPYKNLAHKKDGYHQGETVRFDTCNSIYWAIYWVIFPTTLFSEFKLINYHNACYTVPCTMLVVCTFSLARARHHSWWMGGEFKRRSRWNGNCTELPRLPLYLILTAFAPEGVFIVPGSKSRWTASLNRLMTSWYWEHPLSQIPTWSQYCVETNTRN